MNIPYHPNFRQSEQTFDYEYEAKLEDQSRNALYESVNILAYKGIKGDAVLLEPVKVNLQLPRPVSLHELPIIADYSYSEENFIEDYARVATMLEEAARPPEPEPTRVVADLDQIIASKDLKLLYEHIDALIAIRSHSPVEWSLKKDEIKKAFGKGINLNDLERIVAAEQRKAEQQDAEEEQDVADIARDWAYTQREEWAYDVRGKIWRHWNGLFWEELEAKSPELGNQAVDALHAAGKTINSQSGMDTFLRCAADARATIFPESQGRLINFANGTLDTETMQIHRQRREDYLTYCLPYDHVPGQHPTISNFLEQTISDPYGRQAYMAHLGLALMRDTKLHNTMILLGTTRSGKTTLLALANAVCGAQDHEMFNFAGHHIFSRELEGKRSRYAWRDHRLVTVDEVPAEALREEEIFKQMAAHSGVEMRGMNKDDHKNNRWRPKMLLAANDQPRYADTVGAVKERCIFVSCPNHRPIEARDLNLIDLLTTEVGAFAASCVFLAMAVLERGYYPRSNSQKLLLERIDRASSTMKSFLAEHAIPDPDSRIAVDFFYQRYITHCDDNHILPAYRIQKGTFSQQLASMRLGVARVRYVDDDGKLTRGYAGIRLRTDQDIWETEEDELRTFQSDAPLIDGVLTVVDGKFVVQKIAVNEAVQPVEPSEEASLTALTDKIENEAPIATPLEEETETSRSPLEQENSLNSVSILSSVAIEPLTEPVQVVDTSEFSLATHVCDVKCCGQDAQPQTEWNGETYGHWCQDHENRLEMMAYGEALGYPRLELSVCSSLGAGVDGWKRFASYADAPVAHVLNIINHVLSEQQEIA